ncbi:MAG TPA: hypothetical protein VMX55_13180 [candidate division Zixibacteria bacterium]|nr:hypothetical protein [candidate division Zixibacteria bacterium]
MKKRMIFNIFAVIIFCLFMLIPNTLSLRNERVSNTQIDALGNPINNALVLFPCIDAPYLISPSNGATIPDDTPYLDWSSVSSGDHYRIQVDDNSDFSSPAFDEFTPAFSGDSYITCTHLLDGHYYWRVRAYTWLGVWGDWSSVWQFTVDTVPPSSPVLVSPPNGAVIYDPTPLLDWNPSSTAVQYNLQVDDSASFSSPNVNINTGSTYHICPTLSNKIWYWHVRARDAAGNWGSFSTYRSFTVYTIPPVLVSPLNGEVTNDPTPLLDWNPSTAAVNYNVQVDDSSSFSSPNINTYTSLTAFTCPTLADRIWYWRIRAQDALGNWGSFSTYRSYTIDTVAPSSPVLVLPTNGIITNDPTPNLDWDTVSTAMVYRVQIDNNDDFSSPILDIYTSSSSYICPTLGDTTYYWRVCARDVAENWGDWSAVWHFEIDTTPPEILTLLSPNNSTIDNDPTPYLEWSSESGAILYQIQIDNDADFLSTIIDSETTNTDYITAALADSVYYWRVRAKDAAENWGDWSVVWNFQIDTIAPSITNVGNNPTSPTDVDSVIVSCDVSDLNGIDLVILHYRINAGIWNDVTMAMVSATNYQIVLGPFSYNLLIEYTISAFDTAINPNEAINDNGGLYYSFTITSSDVTGPTITTITPTPDPANDTEPITISCDVYDDNGIQSVTFYYRVNSGSWVDIDMTFMPWDTYEVSIGAFDYADFIEYYIIAIDDSPNHNEVTDDNGGTYYNCTIVSSDLTGPIIDSILHIPISPDETETITISCSVTDKSEIQNATLYYRVNSGDWISESLILVSGSTYEVTIGTFAYNDFIEYYITAFDDHPVHNVATDDNEGVYYNFTIVSSDVTGPTISSVNHAPSTPNATDTITISCSVVDTNGIQVVSLFYRVNSGSWVGTNMPLDTGDIYLATIGTFNDNETVEYYISATDDSPNQNVVIDDNEGVYYSFTVYTLIPSLTTTSETSLILLIPFVVVLLSTIIIRKRKNY